MICVQVWLQRWTIWPTNKPVQMVNLAFVLSLASRSRLGHLLWLVTVLEGGEVGYDDPLLVMDTMSIKCTHNTPRGNFARYRACHVIPQFACRNHIVLSLSFWTKKENVFFCSATHDARSTVNDFSVSVTGSWLCSDVELVTYCELNRKTFAGKGEEQHLLMFVAESCFSSLYCLLLSIWEAPVLLQDVVGQGKNQPCVFQYKSVNIHPSVYVSESPAHVSLHS